MKKIEIKPIVKEAHKLVLEFFQEDWGAKTIVTRGALHNVEDMSGFLAMEEEMPVGLLLYSIKGKDCEIVFLNTKDRDFDIGYLLIDGVNEEAVEKRCGRLWLVVGNDNIEALKFYQKKDFSLVAIHKNAFEHSRKLKPEIPLIGMDGIPLRDEIELELIL